MTLGTLRFSLSALVFLAIKSALGQGTEFTYQGRLNDNASPANGIYDLRFAIYDSTNIPGTVIAGPRTNAAITVSNGLFSVGLDFGANVFTGPARWLEIGVRAATEEGEFTTLTPRQALAATPYAIAAASLTGTLPAAQLSGASVFQPANSNLTNWAATTVATMVSKSDATNAALAATSNLTPAQSYLLAIGDSMTDYGGIPGSASWVEALQHEPNWAGRAGIINAAKCGDRLEGDVAYFTARYGPFMPGPGQHCIALVWKGYNDIGNSTTAITNLLKTLWGALKSKGCYVVAGTIIGHPEPGPGQTQRDEINAFIRNNEGVLYDKLFDVMALNPTYYDGIHPDAQFSQVMADWINENIKPRPVPAPGMDLTGELHLRPYFPGYPSLKNEGTTWIYNGSRLAWYDSVNKRASTWIGIGNDSLYDTLDLATYAIPRLRVDICGNAALLTPGANFYGGAFFLTNGSPALATNNETASDGMALVKRGDHLVLESVSGIGAAKAEVTRLDGVADERDAEIQELKETVAELKAAVEALKQEIIRGGQ